MSLLALYGELEILCFLHKTVYTMAMETRSKSTRACISARNNHLGNRHLRATARTRATAGSTHPVLLVCTTMAGDPPAASLSLFLQTDARIPSSDPATMQAVRPAAEEQTEAEAQEVREVVRAAQEDAPEEKEVAMVGEQKAAEAEADEEVEAETEIEAEAGASAKKNRIQVSTNKKPLYFYVNLAKVGHTTFHPNPSVRDDIRNPPVLFAYVSSISRR
jgi:hypothetical protein